MFQNFLNLTTIVIILWFKFLNEKKSARCYTWRATRFRYMKKNPNCFNNLV